MGNAIGGKPQQQQMITQAPATKPMPQAQAVPIAQQMPTAGYSGIVEFMPTEFAYAAPPIAAPVYAPPPMIAQPVYQSPMPYCPPAMPAPVYQPVAPQAPACPPVAPQAPQCQPAQQQPSCQPSPRSQQLPNLQQLEQEISALLQQIFQKLQQKGMISGQKGASTSLPSQLKGNAKQNYLPVSQAVANKAGKPTPVTPSKGLAKKMIDATYNKGGKATKTGSGTATTVVPPTTGTPVPPTSVTPPTPPPTTPPSSGNSGTPPATGGPGGTHIVGSVGNPVRYMGPANGNG